ncbi:uncharacterized protein KIAA2013 homolog [Pectinophora gossypiella]|uniref:uncharacterized protein KIAA2013 homolog n=1 Tax=Pectinophora gossypiella TaxID=13191 RepID=UPI00214EA911|nr:uncharacterized protein KIAA2013 homolog [Pectinophora gossypiella]
MESARSDLNDMSRRAGEVLRRLQRFVDGPMSRKKVVVLLLIVIFLLLYVGPTIIKWMFGSEDSASHQNVCQKNFLSPFDDAFQEYDAYLRHETTATLSTRSHNYVPYVGNGLLGLALEHDSHLNIKYGRTLSLPVYYHPLYIVDDYEMKEFTVAEYKKGIIHRFQCSNTGIHVAYHYYAHRTIPSLFVQEIWVNNPTNKGRTLKLSTPRVSDWSTSVKQTIKLHQGVDAKDYEVVSGMVTLPDSDKVVAVAVVTRKMENKVSVDARDGLDMLIFTTVQYSTPIKKSEYAKQKDIVEKNAIAEMEKVIALTGDRTAVRKLRENHSRVWESLWYTGFYISDSKAEGIINGDRINATIYAILSQVKSLEHEENIKLATKSDILRTLTYSEGCYEGHSTLDAFNLWKPLNNLENLNKVASVWLLTLEKQGCHKLLKAGASGVNQAMILSFGSLRFSNQHLEYNIHPSKLHRDFLFRRINYGNMTHVNISVIVQEDNKAAIFVALDRSDKTYYACDAGCLDSPVQLGPYRKYFPVKLTEPLTAILYVTADRQHMEDLRHAIHVREVVEAPAHEHHVIALHKHGHSFGALNPLFWISIIVLIVVFHLFLCRIIMNEFCDSGVSYRRLYNKP